MVKVWCISYTIPIFSLKRGYYHCHNRQEVQPALYSSNVELGLVGESSTKADLSLELGRIPS